jgi:hypothetical protein
MPEITHDELKAIIEEAITNHHTTCRLTEDDILAIKTVSGFLTRCRNAIGNGIMVLIAVLLIMGIGGILYLASAGHINLFKVFGLGA